MLATTQRHYGRAIAMASNPFACALGRRDAICVDQVWTDQRADDPNPLFYQIDRRAMQFQLVAPPDIAAQIEGTAITDQNARLVYPSAHRYHRYAATIAIMPGCA